MAQIILLCGLILWGLTGCAGAVTVTPPPADTPARPAPASPTATLIPPPSPTPTPTPWNAIAAAVVPPPAASPVKPMVAAVRPTATPAAAAPTGQLLALTGSGGQLYAVNADGSNLRYLAGGVIDPAVSPDGREVAFTRWDGAELGALFVLNLANGSERVVADDIRQPKSPTWSPDGQKIIISFQHGGLRNPQPTCRSFDADDGLRLPDNVTIISTDVRAGKLRVCFVRHEDLHWFLRQVDVTGGHFEDLPSDRYAYNPSWDPQQPWRVIYSGDKGLMQFDVTTNRQWPVTADLRDKEPVFAPNGQMLAITYKQHDHWEIYTLNLASGERSRLTQPPLLANPQYNSAAPAWSPDGRYLAFVTDRAGPWAIWVMAADGSNPRPLLPPAVQAQLPLAYRGMNERLLNWLK